MLGSPGPCPVAAYGNELRLLEAKHRGLSCGIDEKKYHTFVSYWKNKEKENLKKKKLTMK